MQYLVATFLGFKLTKLIMTTLKGLEATVNINSYDELSSTFYPYK